MILVWPFGRAVMHLSLVLCRIVPLSLSSYLVLVTLSTCCFRHTATNAVEDSLSPMLIGGNKSFVDSLRVFLRASIAQFLQVGPGAAPPKLPMVPPRTLLTVAKTHENSFPSLGPKTCAISPAQQEPSEQRQDGSWVTALKRGNSKHRSQPKSWTATSSGQSKKLATTLSQKQKTGVQNNGVAKSISKDDRLFDRFFQRIPRNHEWRSFTPAGIREAIIRKLGCPPTTIDRIIPVASGYAIVAKDETGRQLLLSLSHRLPEDILLEAARDWVSYMLPNIPSYIVTIKGRKPVAESEVIAELERVTGLIPKSVRYRGKSKVEAPYRTWMVFFDKDSAHKPGFRLFDDSGRAASLKP
ncbi:putative eka-like protein [Erysiphe necator]|uniref:Putative eka-like protein n=1 Tax=Uncinula necator TaxID=52586 RepID=A0A0B1NWM7_UNCNE|nr:putative eka-like protein [Erysiphe necator]